MFEEGKLISFVGVFVTDEAWLFKAKKRAYTLFPNVRSLILFRSYRSQPSMAICFFFSTVGFASFFGTKSFRMPCLNSALISSSLHILTDIEASAHGSGITLSGGCSLPVSFSFSSLSRPFVCLDGQITILQRCLNLIFRESRQIHIQLVAVILSP